MILKSANHSGLSDNIRSTNNWTCTEPNGCVKIRESPGIENPLICVPTLLKQLSESIPNNAALVYKRNDELKTITYSELIEKVRVIAKAFLRLGLERYHAVSIIGGNSAEWIYVYLAAIMAGGTSSGIYQTNLPDACLHCIRTACSDIVVVENDNQLQKILKIKDRAPHLKAIIQIDGKPTDSSVLSWNEVIEMGTNESSDRLNEVVHSLSVNEACTLIFTSGTTSLPKGVLLSHDNLIFDASMMVICSPVEYGTGRILSYLPLSHVAALVFELYQSLVTGACLYIAEKNVLKGMSIIDNLKMARPTVFLGTPRIFEKIGEYIRDIEMKKSSFERYILEKSKSTAIAYYAAFSDKDCPPVSVKYRLFNYFFYSSLKALVGLDQCNFMYSGAAPLSSHVRSYLASFDIPVGEMYGMSECSGLHLFHRYYYSSSYTGGKSGPAVKTKIDKPDMSGEGEICLWGRNVCMGYVHEPQKTRDTFDEEGWLHSGDIGKMNEKSWVQITGRKKEILITSGGENIPPTLIEHNIKFELPFISHAVLIGERKMYLTVLLTLKCKVDSETGMPLDELTPENENWCRSLGYPYKTVSEIVNNNPPKIYEEIQNGIDRANSKTISSAQRIQKFKILPRDFSMITGEIGPTNKLIRQAIYDKYKSYIDLIYSN